MSDPKMYIVSVRVWMQASGNYDAEAGTRTRLFSSFNTLEEVNEWVKDVSKLALRTGDPVITVAEGSE